MDDSAQPITPQEQPSNAQSVQENVVSTPQPFPQTQQSTTPPQTPAIPSTEEHKNTSHKSKLLMIFLLCIAMVTLGVFAGFTLMKYLPSQKEKTAIPATTKQLKKITVQLSWYNTAEFAGFYMAQVKDFYKDAGLDVQLLEAAPPKTPAESLIEGKADFGVTGIDGILLARENGHPMKALAAIYQQSPVTFITLKNSGIEKPQDFAGKRVTIEIGSNAEYPQRALLKKMNLTNKIKEIPSTYNINQLINHETDVFAGFVTNEPILLELLGHPVNNILVVDYGINYYPNLIFTSEEKLTKDKVTVQDFISATVKGYEYALEHPEEAVTETMKRKSGLGKLDPEHQRRTMSVQSPLIFTGKTPLGWMEESIWEQGKQILLEQGIIKGGYDIKSVYTNEFIKKN